MYYTADYNTPIGKLIGTLNYRVGERKSSLNYRVGTRSKKKSTKG